MNKSLLLRGVCGMTVVLGLANPKTPINATEKPTVKTERKYLSDNIPIEEWVKRYEKKSAIEELTKYSEEWENYGVDLETLNHDRLKVLERGMELVGTPYRYGGTSPKTGFDCSGYTQYVFKDAFDVDISRTSSTQPRSSKLEEIPLDEAQTGDLVYRVGSHAMIYISTDEDGTVNVLHSPHSGDRVKIEPYYTSKLRAFRPTFFEEDNTDEKGEGTVGETSRTPSI